MKHSFEDSLPAKEAIRSRAKRSKILNRAAAVAAIACGVSLGIAGEKDEPVIPGAVSLAVLVGSGVSVAVDSKRMTRRCHGIVGDYAISQNYRGDPTTSIAVSIADYELRATPLADADASQEHVTRNTGLALLHPIPKYLGHYMTGAGAMLISAVATNENVALKGEAPSSDAAGYGVGGVVGAIGVGCVAARELWIKQSEEAFVRQIDNIESGGHWQ